MRILVAIASYGTRNDQYLAELINQYGSMPYDIDIVVLSNTAKWVGPGVEVLVGLPTKNPWSLPFGHKKLFADRADDYDLFIYSEDDTPLSRRNIDAFLKVTDILPNNEVAGFLRSETGKNSRQYFPDIHGRFHWDCRYVERRSGYTFAFFTNEHSACYVLTREQLKKAIASGGFLVEPHEEKYDLLCTAATDPYTQCGMRKMICISHLQDFIVPHLPNKYIGSPYSRDEDDFYTQVDALQNSNFDRSKPAPLFRSETGLKGNRYSKLYYEPIRNDLRALIPTSTRTVLSLGCGWGAMEGALVQQGMRVVAVPLDPIIGACARARGVEVVCADFGAARAGLHGQRFDCLLISNLLHLVPAPEQILASFRPLLDKDSIAIALVPNLSRASVLWGRLSGNDAFTNLGNYKSTGVNLTSHRILRQWFTRSGMRIERLVDVVPENLEMPNHLTLGLAARWLASELIALATMV